jgi:hypothetical protein
MPEALLRWHRQLVARRLKDPGNLGGSRTRRRPGEGRCSCDGQADFATDPIRPGDGDPLRGGAAGRFRGRADLSCDRRAAEHALRAQIPEAVPRALEDRRLVTEIHAAREGYRRVDGVRKTWKQLHRRGVEVGRDRVARLMRAEGLEGVWGA